MQSMRADECPVKFTVDIIGGKWKPLILFFLKEGARRPGELQRLIVGITKKVLIEQLRELEQDNIVERRVYDEKPPKVEYFFTEHGLTLSPILQLMSEWGSAQRAGLAARCSRREDSAPSSAYQAE
jgi:DNA-binding HxlR family transcriptional regulator